MKAITYGECYLDHYEKFFGEPVEREVFEQDEESPSLQVLFYDHVFPDSRLFASLGLSHYYPEVKKIAEVFVAADDGHDDVAALLANALFFLVQKKMEIGRGIAVAGLNAISAEFAERFDKRALYITHPFGLPKKAWKVNCKGSSGTLYQAFPISEQEYKYFRKNGAEKFEDLLEQADVDPLVMARPSAAK